MNTIETTSNVDPTSIPINFQTHRTAVPITAVPVTTVPGHRHTIKTTISRSFIEKSDAVSIFNVIPTPVPIKTTSLPLNIPTQTWWRPTHTWWRSPQTWQQLKHEATTKITQSRPFIEKRVRIQPGTIVMMKAM